MDRRFLAFGVLVTFDAAVWLDAETNLAARLAQARAEGTLPADVANELLAIKSLARMATGQLISASGTLKVPSTEPASDSKSELIDTATAAGLLGVSPRMVRKYIDSGQLPASPHGRQRWVSREAVIELRRHRAA